MSLILDALKKADDKRSNTPEQAPPKPEAVPFIHASQDSISAEALKAIAIKNWVMLCVCLFLCGLIVVLLYLLLNSKNERSLQNHPSEAPVLRPIQRHIIQPTPQNLPPSTDQNIDSLYAQATPQTYGTAQNTLGGAKQQPSRETQKIYDQTRASQSSQRLTPTQQSATKNPSAIKDIKQLPQPFQESIPTIFYTQHTYPQVEGEPSVVLNKKTLREGDSLDNGIYVHAILENKVILIKDNTYFSLQARNSWVNF